MTDRDKLLVLSEDCQVLGIIFDPFPPMPDMFADNYDVAAAERESEAIWVRIRTQFPGAHHLAESLMSMKDSRVGVFNPNNFPAVEIA